MILHPALDVTGAPQLRLHLGIALQLCRQMLQQQVVVLQRVLQLLAWVLLLRLGVQLLELLGEDCWCAGAAAGPPGAVDEAVDLRLQGLAQVLDVAPGCACILPVLHRDEQCSFVPINRPGCADGLHEVRFGEVKLGPHLLHRQQPCMYSSTPQL